MINRFSTLALGLVLVAPSALAAKIVCDFENFEGVTLNKEMPEKSPDLEQTKIATEYAYKGNSYDIDLYMSKRGLDSKYAFLARVCQRSDTLAGSDWHCVDQFDIVERDEAVKGVDWRWTVSSKDGLRGNLKTAQTLRFACKLVD